MAFRNAANNVLYIQSMDNRPPPVSPRAPSPVRSDTAASVSQVQYVPQSPPPPNPNHVVMTNHNSPGPYYPNRNRSPSPIRRQKPEPLKPKPSKKPPYQARQRGHYGSANDSGKAYQGANWGKRRCCTLLWAILLVLLLAALAVGIYFLYKYIKDEEAKNAQDVVNPGGTYVNGLYIITSTYAPSESQGIFGHDRACNPYNNNTSGDNNVTYPDCNTLTTRIVPINYTTTTTASVVTTVASAHITTSCLVTLLTSVLFYSVAACFP